MNADKILMDDLGTDALTYIQRSLVDLDPITRASIAAEFAAGQPFEVRVRMWGNGTAPVFTVVQIEKDGERPIHTTGTGP